MAKLQGDQNYVSTAGESSTATHASFSPTPDLARVFVRLSNGMKIVVPIPQGATVHGLHTQALQRAAKLGVNGTLDTTLLRTTGRSPVVLFGEDFVVDILDLTQDSTFSLEPLNSPSTTALESNGDVTSDHGSQPSYPRLSAFHDLISPVHQKDSGIYVRWITLESALENSRLRKIPIDKIPIPYDTTLAEFYCIAVDRLVDGSSKGSCILPTKLNLYLRECKLHTEKNLSMLKDLGPGSKTEPLDIFVEFTRLEPHHSLSQLSLSSDPKTLWGFDSTNRGMSTFITSLQMLLKEIERGHCNLEGLLEVILELTHFPPLLLALRSVYERGLDTRTPLPDFLLIASAFHSLCRIMVPSKICQSSESFLEASRQVVFWIYSMRSEASIARGSSIQLVHRAQIKELNHNSEDIPPFLPFQTVDLPSASNLGSRKFLVSVEAGDKALCRYLASALHDKSPLPWTFYVRPADWSILWDHKIIPKLHPNDFDNLIETTNSVDAFRIVGPLQLGACLAAELPVITLSSKGYVSRYDHEDLECSERSFITWNAIEGREKLPDNPSQFLSQKLDPIIVERKKLDNWKVDAWPEWTKAADFGPPDEAIVICVDTSSSMDYSMDAGWIADQSTSGVNPSRLTEVKEFFKNLTLRISALNLSTHLGLVTFSNNATVKQPLTALHLNFNHQLDNIQASGMTAIFDALDKAYLMLDVVKNKYPKTKLRIILLTDGEDNKSTLQPSAVSTSLYKKNIVLDAVVIGSTQTSNLFKIARNTGGYAFNPKTQQSLFQIFLLETVVDIRTRPDIARESWSKWETFQPKPADMANPYEFPPCRPHPNVDDYFFALSDAERFMNRMSRRSTRSSSSVFSGSTRLSMASTINAASGLPRILLSEIKAMIQNPHDFMDVYVSQRNMGFWKVVMQGPPDSAYADGTFLLYIEMGTDFPRRPPSARFITPMLHPNITKHGRVCHPIFDREWTPITRIYQVLQQLYGILMSLEARDAVDPLASLRFWSDAEEGKREVRSYVNRFANRSRALYRAEIIGDDVSTLDSSSIASSTASTPTSSSATPSDSPPNSNNSPSNQSSLSASVTSSRPVSTTSTLFGYLANQRRPPQAPPLMVGQGSSNSADGRNRFSRRSGVPSQASGTEDVARNPGGGTMDGRRLSRRASFFSLFRNAGN